MKEIPHPSSANKDIAIGFVRRGYSSTGGAEAYLTRLAEGLLSQGYRVILLGTGEWPVAMWPGGEVIVLPHGSLDHFATAVHEIKQQQNITLLFSLERIPGCDLFRAGDGVHAAWLDHKVKKEPWWQRWCSQWNWRHRAVLRLEQTLFNKNQTTQVIVNSRMVAHEIEAYFKFSKESITVIPNGVPKATVLTKKERVEARKQFGMSEEECVVLFVGSGWKRKGVATAIKAVEIAGLALQKKKNPQRLRLWVAGKGRSSRYGSSSVCFLGPVTREITSLYAAADLFILPTLYDPFSNASLEALASGLPVITSSMNGCTEIMIPSVHGSIIEDPTDSTSFAEALVGWQQRLEDPEEEIHVRNCCVQLGAEFSTDRNLQATLGVIQRVLKELKSKKE